MKRNVSIKVFATKAGDMTDRAEKPVDGAANPFGRGVEP